MFIDQRFYSLFSFYLILYIFYIFFFFHFDCLLFLWFFYFRRYFSFYSTFPDTFFFQLFLSVTSFSSNKLISLPLHFLISKTKKKKFLFFLSFWTFCISDYCLLYASYFGFRLLILFFLSLTFFVVILYLGSSGIWDVFLVCMEILHWENIYSKSQLNSKKH